MKLEDQVCSLELAKRLKELGVKQEPAFYWHKDVTWRLDYWDQMLIDQHENYSAFTVAELGEILPKWIKGHHLMISRASTWFLRYRGGSSIIPGEDEPEIEDDKEADARALMLIYLIENGLYETK